MNKIPLIWVTQVYKADVRPMSSIVCYLPQILIVSLPTDDVINQADIYSIGRLIVDVTDLQ